MKISGTPSSFLRLLAVAERVRERGGLVAFDNNYRPRLWPDVAAARSAFAAATAVATLALMTLDDEQALWGQAAPACAATARWRCLRRRWWSSAARSRPWSAPPTARCMRSPQKRCPRWWTPRPQAIPSLAPTWLHGWPVAARRSFGVALACDCDGDLPIRRFYRWPAPSAIARV